MLQVDVDEPVVGRISEVAALLQQLVVEGRPVVGDHLTDDGQLRLSCLQDDQTALLFAACTSADLCHHHKGMLVGSEVRLVEHGVGIEDAHYADAVEVETLAHHLRADEDVGAPLREVADNVFVGVA